MGDGRAEDELRVDLGVVVDRDFDPLEQERVIERFGSIHGQGRG